LYALRYRIVQGVASVKAALDNRFEIKGAEITQMKEIGFLETIEKIRGLGKQEPVISHFLVQQSTEKNLER